MKILIDIAENRFNRLKEGKIPHGCIAEKMILKAVKEGVPTVEAIPKADYENRLKADMVAMLTELQLEIEELDSRAGYDGNGMPTFSTDYIRKKKVNELIQQKINSLKENLDVC